MSKGPIRCALEKAGVEFTNMATHWASGSGTALLAMRPRRYRLRS
jgi:hypothetical protein